MKHLPFISNYRTDFEVVEERRGNFRFFPHTQQLPVLLRAIHLEFYGGLPDRVARVDERAKGFDRLALKASADVYCEIFNQARKDELRLFPLMKPNLAATIAIVQQITEETPRGRVHRFRFYAGENFSTEIYFSGWHIAISDHLLQRLAERVPLHPGTELYVFLSIFFNRIPVCMKTGEGRALVYDWHDSLVAFPFHENPGDELFFLTCLTLPEIHSLEVEIPTTVFTAHYVRPFVRPRVRHWFPPSWAKDVLKQWEKKDKFKKLGNFPKVTKKRNWFYATHWVRDQLKQRGHGEGSDIYFFDDVVGPLTLELRPKDALHMGDERELYQLEYPDVNWDEWIISEDAKAAARVG